MLVSRYVDAGASGPEDAGEATGCEGVGEVWGVECSRVMGRPSGGKGAGGEDVEGGESGVWEHCGGCEGYGTSGKECLRSETLHFEWTFGILSLEL